ncbi:GntR family transcriptional regulator [Pseudonocardia sp.]|uniref:GntR family transcriptional regulator n=1 Tax=Pseudonocardia sp. TaxID=60912 RepID=UPI003D0DC3F0
MVSTDGDGARVPASERLAAELRSAIESGALAPGAKLPSERELAEQHRIARNTVRQAIRLLAESGLVVAEHGRGVFVRPATAVIRLGNDRYSPRYRSTGLSPFLLECAKQGKAGRFEVLLIERTKPPPDVARRLKLPPDDESVLRRENVFWADNDPVQRVTTWIPWPIAEGTPLLSDDVGHPFGIHGIFEERGHTMARILDEIGARMPTPDERQNLRLPAGVPVLDVLHTSIDTEGEPYELTRFVMRADLSGLRYDAPVE